MNKNVTVQLDDATIQKRSWPPSADSVAGSSPEQIDLLAQQDDDYDRAVRDALAELERGYDLGRGPYPARDEVHDDGSVD